MQTRNAFLLPLAIVMAVACGDVPPPEPTRPEQKSTALREEVRRERERVASRQLVQASSEATLSTGPELATALDIPANMLTSALLTSPAGANTAVVLPSFGVIKPHMGNTLGVLSTGPINLNNDPAVRAPEPGTDFAPAGPDGDVVTLRLTFNVRPGLSRLSFSYLFLSAESPDYVGSEYNDTFTATLIDAQGTRLIEETSVNSAHFYDASATRANGTGFVLEADDPAGIDYFPITSPQNIPTFPDAGITHFTIVNVPIVPIRNTSTNTNTVTLEFTIRDLGDGILDSAVVLDNIGFASFQVVDPYDALIDKSARTVQQNLEALADETKGTPVRAVAADGVTQLVVRAKVAGPGSMTFSLPGATGLNRGGLSAIGSGLAPTNTLTVPVQQLSTGYYALAMYTSPTDFNDGLSANVATRPLTLSAAFTASGQTTPVIETLPLLIARPPVVYVHDLWSSCLYWVGSARIARSALFTVTCADYARTNAESINSDTNKEVVARAVDEALTEHRGNGIAATQVDVVAHGMGGLLARKFVDRPDYKDWENYDKGYFKRLITVNTPHLGMRMAEELYKVREATQLAQGSNTTGAWTTFSNSLRAVGINVDDGGAIDDLRPGSDAIKGIGVTSVPSHLLVSTAGNNIDHDSAMSILLPATRTLYTQMQFRHPMFPAGTSSDVRKRLVLTAWSADPALKSKIFCDDQHDLFLAIAEQRGAVSPTAITEFNVVTTQADSEHFRVMSNEPQDTRITALLNTPIASASFAASLPSPLGITLPNSCNSSSLAPPRQEAGDDTASPPPSSVTPPLLAAGLQILAPAPGTTVSPGGRLTVTVQATGGFLPSTVVVTGAGHAAFMHAAPFTTTLTIPAHALGAHSLVAHGFDIHGNEAESAAVPFNVVTTARLTQLSVINGDTTLRGAGSTRQLVVVGHYDDGVIRDLSAPEMGTVYSASNEGILTVTTGGTITAVGPGTATVGIRNSGISTSISAKVTEGSTRHCLDVFLGDYNLFVLEDYQQGLDIGGRVAAGGNISLKDFQIGWKLPASQNTNVLVAGNNLSLNNGTVWGNVRYGNVYTPQGSLVVNRGTVARGNPIDFAGRGAALKALSTQLATLPPRGTVTVEPWGGILLKGTAPDVNVFYLESGALNVATLLSIDAPANSLAVINIRGNTARFANFGHLFAGGINEQGVLFNLSTATNITAVDYGFYGTVLAPNAHMQFTSGSFVGGIYARSLTGDAVGHIAPLRDTTVCR